MDPVILTIAISGWSAFSGLAVYVMRSVANGSWVPIRTHLRDVDMMTESRNEWRAASKEDRATVSLLVKSQGITADFFQKVPVATTAHPGEHPLEGR